MCDIEENHPHQDGSITGPLFLRSALRLGNRSRGRAAYAPAQFNIGERYHFGGGVKLDYAEALQWYRLAAKQGNTRAQFNIGLMYAIGDGVRQDDRESAKWYRSAA